MALAESDLAGSEVGAACSEQPTFLATVELDPSFEEVYRAHAPDVERVVRRYVKDRARAEDLAQETFLRAYRAWPAVDTGRPIWPWLRTIAHRVCIDAWRSESAGVRVVSTESTSSDIVSRQGDPSESLMSSLRCEEVRETLLALEPRQRRILLLRDLHGLRYEEIAKIEGTTLAALRCSLARARQRFRKTFLTVAADRGLNTILWPIFIPLLRWIRALRSRGGRLAATVVQRPNVLANAETFASATPAQVSSGILVVAFVIGSLGSVGHQRLAAAPPAVSEASVSAALVEDGEPVSGGGSGIWSPAGGGEYPAAGPADEQAGFGPRDSEDDGATSDIPGSSPSLPADLRRNRDEVAEPPVKRDDVTNPNASVYQPEDAWISSFAPSPAEDGTFFAAGYNRECATQVGCPAVLFRSTDAGASWTRLNAEGFDGGALALPPAYGAGNERIFAMSSAGILRVSDDGGATFRTAAALESSFHGSIDISPAFDDGDPRILIGTQSNLFQYRDDSRTIGPAPYSATPGSLEPVFATRDVLMVGGRMLDERRRWGSAVFRCVGSVCTGTRFSDEPTTPKLRLSPSFAEDGLMHAFTGSGMFFSADGGTSFSSLATPWVDATLVDLAIAEEGERLFAAAWRPEANGEEGLYGSHDAGSTWTKFASPVLEGGVTLVRVVGTRVFAGLAHGGVACSSDLGATWRTRC